MESQLLRASLATAFPDIKERADELISDSLSPQGQDAGFEFDCASLSTTLSQNAKSIAQALGVALVQHLEEYPTGHACIKGSRIVFSNVSAITAEPTETSDPDADAAAAAREGDATIDDDQTNADAPAVTAAEDAEANADEAPVDVQAGEQDAQADATVATVATGGDDVVDDDDDSPQWERVQKKTFRKWCNKHIGKRFGADATVKNILTDWESGIKLMQLAVSLYEENEKNPAMAVSMPKLRKNELNPSSRIQKVNTGGRALSLLKKAGVRIMGIQAENLVDHDKVPILGMIWVIILDYASRGFGGGSSAELKRALLEWVNKHTQGYERVNPPGVKNFTKDWRSGLAWCALIHRHRPNLIDYQACLGQSNAENLELAFSVAEEHVDIPRLLDVEDVDNDVMDDKSIMTYVLEYFHAFASDGAKEAAAAQAAEWVKFIRELRENMNDYERRARILSDWMAATKAGWDGYDFGSTKVEAQEAFAALRSFIGDIKPPQEQEKMDLEALFAEIQTTLIVNGLAAYVPPADLTSDALDDQHQALEAAQSLQGQAVRAATFKFIEKHDDTASAELLQQIQDTFKHYDSNTNGSLSATEFFAACMEMGIDLKTAEEKDAVFAKVAGGNETVSFAEWSEWLQARMVMRMDDPDSVKAAFKAIADGKDGLTEANLNTPPLTDDDRAFLKEHMLQDENGLYNFDSFVDTMMAAHAH